MTSDLKENINPNIWDIDLSLTVSSIGGEDEDDRGSPIRLDFLEDEIDCIFQDHPTSDVDTSKKNLQEELKQDEASGTDPKPEL